MKLYIDNITNYKIDKIDKIKLNKLNTIYKNTTKLYKELHSENYGIYYITIHNIYKIYTSNLNFIYLNNYFNNYDIILDKSVYEKKEIYSQLPSDNYFIIYFLELEYIVNDNISIIIKGNYDNKDNTINLNLFKPVEFYFEIKNTNDVDFIKQDILDIINIIL